MDSPSDQVPDRSSSRPAERRPVEKDFGLSIDRDGTWYHDGAPIRRLPLVKLFATVLERDADGAYWLETPVERGRIAVEDVPFVAVELAVEGASNNQRLHLRTNLDEWITVGPAHPLSVREAPWQEQEQADAGPVPYVEVRRGLEARLLRPVFYELVEFGEEREVEGRTRFGVASEGAFFPLDASEHATERALT